MVAESKNDVVIVPRAVKEAIDRLQQDYDLGFYNRPELEAMAADDPRILPAVREVLDIVSVDEFVAPGITIWVEEPEENHEGTVWVQASLKERNERAWEHSRYLRVEVIGKPLAARGIFKVALHLV